MTLDNLMPFECNRALLAAIRSIAAAHDRAARWLFVHAGAGAGKTHLLSACADLAARRKPILVNLVELSLEIREAEHLGCRSSLRDALVSADLLLLDDVHLASGDRRAQDELLAVLDRRLISRRATVMTGLESPANLEGLDPQIRSRLSAGPIVPLEIGTEEERFQLLRNTIPVDELSDDVLRYVAGQVQTSIRQLIAASHQLRFTQIGLDEPITPEIARAMVPMPGDVLPSSSSETTASSIPAGAPPSARYRKMLTDAETHDEQMLALQIAISDRLRRPRPTDDDSKVQSLRSALESLREGDAEAALTHLRNTSPAMP